MLRMVTEFLREDGHEVSAFTSGGEALSALEAFQPELVVTDLYLERNRAQGLEILQRARGLNPPPAVVMITGFATVETAVEAMKLGAFDYLEKPFKLDELKMCVERGIAYGQAIAENVYLRKQVRTKYRFDQLIGSSPAMQAVCKLIERVADTDSNILILGESGTGKELVARALHFNSKRQYGQFIPVNCSALPENLLESELFGHKKGSFTGAIADKRGLFQEADGGTIFLDEVGTMSQMLQSRLLRVLQDREIRRVGDNIGVQVNVRVVAATNEPLERRVREGKFREDLFYRLNVIPIVLPRLLDRRDDIPLLAAHFLRNKMAALTGRTCEIDREVMDILNAYDWPGNVRELENVLERACALCEGQTIRKEDLPRELLVARSLSSHEDSPEATQSNGPSLSGIGRVPMTTFAVNDSLKRFVRDQEVAYINRALTLTAGDKEKAAGLLGISLATLYRKISEPETD